MDLLGARLAEHLDHGPRRGAPDDRVVDDHQPTTDDVLAQRIELHADPEGPHLLVGSDEGPADVAVLDQTVTEGNPRGAGVSLGRRDPRLGHPHHQVGLGGACSASCSPMRTRAAWTFLPCRVVSGRAK